MHLFWAVCNFSISYSDLDTKLSRHNQNLVELKHYTGVVLDMVLDMFFSMHHLQRDIDHNLELEAYRLYTTEITKVHEWILVELRIVN